MNIKKLSRDLQAKTSKKGSRLKRKYGRFTTSKKKIWTLWICGGWKNWRENSRNISKSKLTR